MVRFRAPLQGDISSKNGGPGFRSGGPFDRIGILQDAEQPSVQSVLDVIDATFKYQGVLMALTRLPQLHPGELVALVGQNGAGKTTLTKLVNGLCVLDLRHSP